VSSTHDVHLTARLLRTVYSVASGRSEMVARGVAAALSRAATNVLYVRHVHPQLRYSRFVPYGVVLMLALSGCRGDGSRSRDESPRTRCEFDEDCVDRRCDPRRGCVECLFDHHCDAEQRCDDRSCRAIVRCSSSDDCTAEAQPVCDENARECVACVTDATTARCATWRAASAWSVNDRPRGSSEDRRSRSTQSGDRPCAVRGVVRDAGRSAKRIHPVQGLVHGAEVSW
jgi:hypothetical protein